MDYNLQKNQNAEQTYHSIRNSIVGTTSFKHSGKFCYGNNLLGNWRLINRIFVR